MPDRHKHPPIRFRPTEANRERIAARAEQTGKAVNAILNEALDVFWQAGDGGPTTAGTAPKAVGPRRKPRASLAPPVVLRAPAPEPARKAAKPRSAACPHRLPSGAWCKACEAVKP